MIPKSYILFQELNKFVQSFKQILISTNFKVGIHCLLAALILQSLVE